MLCRHAISDADWDRIKHLLPGQRGQHGGIAKDNRLFIDAILYVARTGIPWEDLPERFGNWNSQWRRFDRWAKKGRWDPILAALRDPDLDVLILDSSAVRAHPLRCGCQKKWDGTGGQDDQALGRSRGGFGTKIHGSFDGLGHPVELLVTAANESDIAQAETLLADHEPEVVTSPTRVTTRRRWSNRSNRAARWAVIPTQKDRKVQRQIDEYLYRERNLCERFWNKAKQYRRVATLYEKKAVNFLAFVKVAAMMVMLQ